MDCLSVVGSSVITGELDGWHSIGLCLLGVGSVLGLIVGLRLNAFLALILSALLVSIGVGFVGDVDYASRLSAVVDAFGDAAGKIGIVIAMASIIGKCMLDSGAADRIVQFAVGVTGEAKASLGLMVAGFFLAVPVFFDTVFYLLVPLGRSLHRRTGKHYLRYLLAITTGAAITHTLVPPTPGPLLVAATLGVPVGTMMSIGLLVAIPAAVAGLLFAVFADARMSVPMRSDAGPADSDPASDITPGGLSAFGDRSDTGGRDGHRTSPDELSPHELSPQKLSPPPRLPSLGIALLPIILPIVLIGSGTLVGTLADRDDSAAIVADDFIDVATIGEAFAAASDDSTPAGRFLFGPTVTEVDRRLLQTVPGDASSKRAFAARLNQIAGERSDIYDNDAFSGVKLSSVTRRLVQTDSVGMKPIVRRRMNRLLLEDTFPGAISPHEWRTPMRSLDRQLGLFSNSNFALTLAALVSMLTLKRVRGLSWRRLGDETEQALMAGGLIILITAAGGAFGQILKDTDISVTIQQYFSASAASGIGLLVLGWSISAVLKIAQGSSTVAMIVGAGMLAAIIGESRPDFHLVYVATAVGSGSLMGSWMNDSGFWIFTKMGGLTESEAIRSWTPLLAVLAVTSLLATIFWSQVLPMVATG